MKLLAWADLLVWWTTKQSALNWKDDHIYCLISIYYLEMILDRYKLIKSKGGSNVRDVASPKLITLSTDLRAHLRMRRALINAG